MGANLGSCPDCGREISLRAKSCPHCGSPKPFATPISEMPVVKPALSAGKIFLGGVWALVKTAFWWALVVAVVRGILFGLAGGWPGLAWGIGGGIAIGGIVGAIVGFFYMVAYWIRGGPKPTLYVVQDAGKNFKPVTEEDLQRQRAQGYFTADAAVSVKGTNDWIPLKNFPIPAIPPPSRPE